MTVSALRSLPSVDKLLSHDALATGCQDLPRTVLVAAARDTLDEARAALRRQKNADLPDADALAHAAAARARLTTVPHLRRVLNGTGIVLHTNLGRAPLAERARRAVAEVAAAAGWAPSAGSPASPAPRPLLSSTMVPPRYS